jgi:predicted Zn finger-like uncharacterized protein
MSQSSSGTKERWEIPDTCPKCNAFRAVQMSEVGSTGAKLKCSECLRAWWIEPTPVWKIADRNTAKLDLIPNLIETLEEARAMLVGVLSVRSETALNNLLDRIDSVLAIARGKD